MRARSWEDFVEFDSEGRMINRSLDSLVGSTISTGLNAPVSTTEDEPNFGPVPVGGGVTGAVDVAGDLDYYTVSLVAGQTYTFSLQGAGPDPITDSFLVLYNPNGTFNQYDDDGGNALYSIITYTAAETGVYYLEASSFPNAGDPGLGTYQLDVREMGADSVGDTNGTAGALDVGDHVIAFLETDGDVDRYAITLEAGQYYTFQVAGSADYETDYLNVPEGTLDTILALYDTDGTLITFNDDNNFPSDISSGLGFYAEEAGTYYLDVQAYPGQTGGYVLNSNAPVDPLTLDPLESLNWDSASNIPTVMVDGVETTYIYFAAAGEDVGTGETTYGWEQHQIDAVMHALNTQYTPITNINYVITTDINEATFKMITVENLTYGARFYPQAPEYGLLQGIGSFNLLSGGFGADPGSLLPGGFSYAVILHEFGHAHGVAHPHDTGGGSDIMLGVTGSGALGVYDLNQGVYTVMSYNDGWITHPNGERTYSAANRDSGWSETLGAFDIAVLQDRYGTFDHNTGDNVYTIADTQEEATYQTIWDTGGTDTIAYGGERDARIDLLAATLDYTPTGGGVVSFVDGVWGGYTIANDVVIENASGGSGDDVLLGNDSDNVLDGNNGDDTIMGRAGDDTVNGGNGTDALHGDAGNDTLNGGRGNDSLYGGEGNDTLNGGNGADRLDGGSGDNELTGGRGGDIFVFTEAGTNTITDYERGEDIDLSGLDVTSADVTVHADRIVVELGNDDLTIMFNTTSFSTDDLFFG